LTTINATKAKKECNYTPFLLYIFRACKGTTIHSFSWVIYMLPAYRQLEKMMPAIYGWETVSVVCKFVLQYTGLGATFIAVRDSQVLL